MLDLKAIFDVDDPPLAGARAACSPTELPIEWWLLWDEGAAIKEFHGDMHRERAEAEALTEIVQMMQEERKEESS